LGINSSAAQCVVTVPASQYWELDDLLPTGRRLQATGPRDLAAGLRFGAAALDDVFTGLQSIDGKVTATIDDPLARRRLSLTFDSSFSECVVFKPPHGEAICIEPYTSVPDALALEQQGIPTGLRHLSAGEMFATHMSLELHP
jgi:aldose 1-epimerase